MPRYIFTRDKLKTELSINKAKQKLNNNTYESYEMLDTTRQLTTLKEGDCISRITHRSPEEIRNLDRQKSIAPKSQFCCTTSPSFER